MPAEASPNKVVNLDYLSLEVDTDRALIRLIWKRQVNSSELRTGFYTAIEVASTYKCKYWIGDARRTTMLDIADQEFLVNDLIEMINKSGIRKIARIVEKEEAQVEDSFSMKLKIESNSGDKIKFTTMIFTDEEAAETWLFSN